jgi:hypothetical protein
LSRERLVNDTLKNLGDLNCILNLPSANKTLGIADVGGRKLGRSATRGLEKVGKVFRAKSGDATIANTSRGCNGISRKTLNK